MFGLGVFCLHPQRCPEFCARGAAQAASALKALKIASPPVAPCPGRPWGAPRGKARGVRRSPPCPRRVCGLSRGRFPWGGRRHPAGPYGDWPHVGAQGESWVRGRASRLRGARAGGSGRALAAACERRLCRQPQRPRSPSLLLQRRSAAFGLGLATSPGASPSRPPLGSVWPL